MSSQCDTVLERIALGEPLGDLAEHAASCEKCKRLVALPVELGALHREADPGLGFSARMTAGVQQRIASRRRRRIATGFAFAVAASAAGVLVVAHHPEAASPSVAHDQGTKRAMAEPPTKDEALEAPDAESNDDLVELVNFDRAEDRADWRSIEEPLAPYRQLIEGTKP